MAYFLRWIWQESRYKRRKSMMNTEGKDMGQKEPVPLFYSEEVDVYAPLKEAKMVSLTCEGLAFTAHERLMENEILTLKFVLPSGLPPKVIHAFGRILKCEYNKHTGTFYYDVQFVYMESSDFSQLLEFTLNRSRSN